MPLYKVGDVVVLNCDKTAYHNGKRAHTALSGYLWTVAEVLPGLHKSAAPKYALVSTEAKGQYTCVATERQVKCLASLLGKGPNVNRDEVAAAADKRHEEQLEELVEGLSGPQPEPGLWEPGEFDAMLARVSAEARGRPRADYEVSEAPIEPADIRSECLRLGVPEPTEW